MHSTELKDLVASYISGSTITEVTELDDFLIVYYVNNEYHKTKDIGDMLVGAGPLLVNKTTKEVFETGSGQIPTYCIQSYHKTGRINSNPGNVIEIRAFSGVADKTKAIIILKTLCNLSSVEAKAITEKATKDISTTIKLESSNKAEEASVTLNKAGFTVEQLWQ